MEVSTLFAIVDFNHKTGGNNSTIMNVSLGLFLNLWISWIKEVFLLSSLLFVYNSRNQNCFEVIELK